MDDKFQDIKLGCAASQICVYLCLLNHRTTALSHSDSYMFIYCMPLNFPPNFQYETCLPVFS